MGELLKHNNLCDVLLRICGILIVTFDKEIRWTQVSWCYDYYAMGTWSRELGVPWESPEWHEEF